MYFIQFVLYTHPVRGCSLHFHKGGAAQPWRGRNKNGVNNDVWGLMEGLGIKWKEQKKKKGGRSREQPSGPGKSLYNNKIKNSKLFMLYYNA